MSLIEQAKRQVGRQAAELVKPNMTVGIGTGSTAYWFILALAEKIKNGLNCKCVPTSKATKELMLEQKIQVYELNDVALIDITIDGADEITHYLQLIKGGGGALLQEKMVAANSKQFIIIADEHKCVTKLGKFPLPVEVVPYGWKHTKRKIDQLGCTKIELRERDGQIYITDHSHYILDCHFNQIEDPVSLQSQLKNIPGVVETGLFLGMANGSIVGYDNGEIRYLS